MMRKSWRRSAGVDRSPWSKETAGRDDGRLGAEWRKITGDEGSSARHRRRYAVAIEDVRGGPGAVERYLVKTLGSELSKTRQQIRRHGEQAQVWTGRTWGRVRGHVLKRFFEPPVTVKISDGDKRLTTINEVARRIFGFELGEITAKDVGGRWVPVAKDDPDAKKFTPFRTRWLGLLGEFVRTGDVRFLYAFGESRRATRRIDKLLSCFGLGRS